MINPVTKPDWATTNPTDPTSGILAIVEPSSGKKQTGFLRVEIPPRQDFNWLFNLIGKWVRFFDRRVSQKFIEGFSISQIVNTNAPTPTVEITFSGGVCGLIDSSHVVNTSKMNGNVNLNKFLTTLGVSTSWTTGVGGHGWGSGCPAISTGWVYAFLLYFEGTDSLDIGFADEPFGYGLDGITGLTNKRRIACFYYDSTFGVHQMKQNGDYYRMVDHVYQTMALTGVNSSGPHIVTLNVPSVPIVANVRVMGSRVLGATGTIWVEEYPKSAEFIGMYFSDPLNQRSIEDKLMNINSTQDIIVKWVGLDVLETYTVSFLILGFFDYREKDL